MGLFTAVHAPALTGQASSSVTHAALPAPPNALPAASTALPARHPAKPHSLLRRIGTGVAAAVLGAGVGYFFSEVALGDWAQQSGHRSISRTLWAGVGGVAAFTLGFSFPIGGVGGSPGKLPTSMYPGGRSVITAKEIEGSGLSTAYDVVESLRPEWLFRRQSHFAQTQAEATIPVYLNDQLLGGLEDLKSIAAQNVKVMYRYTAAEATLLRGNGGSSSSGGGVTPGEFSSSNAEGAIQVITKQ